MATYKKSFRRYAIHFEAEWPEKTFEGEIFWFLLSAKTDFSGHNKIWGKCPPVAMELVSSANKFENHWFIGLITRVRTD